MCFCVLRYSMYLCIMKNLCLWVNMIVTCYHVYDFREQCRYAASLNWMTWSFVQETFTQMSLEELETLVEQLGESRTNTMVKHLLIKYCIAQVSTVLSVIRVHITASWAMVIRMLCVYLMCNKMMMSTFSYFLEL